MLHRSTESRSPQHLNQNYKIKILFIRLITHIVTVLIKIHFRYIDNSVLTTSFRHSLTAEVLLNKIQNYSESGFSYM